MIEAMFLPILIYFLSFTGIWIGAGIAIKAIERISRTIRVSQFAISFLLLGFFTSISEFSVGINAVIENDPEIYVGNLIGGSIVIFMLIIPLLAILGRPIRITPEFQGFNLLASLIVVAMPVILAMDGRVSKVDSIISICLFALLMFSVQTKRGVLEKLKHMSQKSSVAVGRELLKVLFGLATVFIASKFVVEQTLFFSELLNVSPFLISLLLIAIGTNIPELAMVARSTLMRSNQVAFGNYVGSAAFNTFFLGLLTLIYGKPVILSNSYLVSLLFLVFGLMLFYYFARTKNSVSKVEGLVLFALYLAFLFTEIMLHKNLLFWY